MGRRKMDSELHRIKLETGTVYQTSKGGNYYFRYQINGERKCVSLKTANQEEAIRKARELLPIVQATNSEVIATHVKIVDHFFIFQKNSLHLKTANFSNPSRWAIFTISKNSP